MKTELQAVPTLSLREVLQMASPVIHKAISGVLNRANCEGLAVFQSPTDSSLSFIGVGKPPSYRFSVEDVRRGSCVLGASTNNPKNPIGLYVKNETGSSKTS